MIRMQEEHNQNVPRVREKHTSYTRTSLSHPHSLHVSNRNSSNGLELFSFDAVPTVHSVPSQSVQAFRTPKSQMHRSKLRFLPKEVSVSPKSHSRRRLHASGSRTERVCSRKSTFLTYQTKRHDSAPRMLCRETCPIERTVRVNFVRCISTWYRSRSSLHSRGRFNCRLECTCVRALAFHGFSNFLAQFETRDTSDILVI